MSTLTFTDNLACELVVFSIIIHHYYLYSFPFGFFSYNLASSFWRDISRSDKSAILVSQSPTSLKQVSFILLSSDLRPLVIAALDSLLANRSILPQPWFWFSTRPFHQDQDLTMLTYSAQPPASWSQLGLIQLHFDSFMASAALHNTRSLSIWNKWPLCNLPTNSTTSTESFIAQTD